MTSDAPLPLFDHPQPHVELNSTVAEEDKPRLSVQCHAIADRLRKGPATNLELIMISHRFGARLHELKLAGFLWKKTGKGQGVYLYEMIRDFLPAAPGDEA